MRGSSGEVGAGLSGGHVCSRFPTHRPTSLAGACEHADMHASFRLSVNYLMGLGANDILIMVGPDHDHEFHLVPPLHCQRPVRICGMHRLQWHACANAVRMKWVGGGKG